MNPPEPAPTPQELSQWIFPLPNSIHSLPRPTIEQFVNDPELVRGYVKTLSRYEEERQRVIQILDDVEGKHGQVSQLVKDYKALSEKIVNQIKTIQSVYQEFNSFEIDQYRLLSNNFNQDFLITNKLKRMLDTSNAESLAIAKKLHDSDDFAELTAFRESRKTYHLRKEKLNRWNEERVSGTI